MSFSGCGSVVPSAGTSNTHPCSFWYPIGFLFPSTVVVSPTFSSPLSHVPHGVDPPAQLCAVPLRLMKLSSNCSVRVLNTRLVHPPGPVGS